MSKIRVLHVFGSLNVGGAETRTMELFRYIDKEKYSFDFLCMQSGKQFYEDEIMQLGGRVIHIPEPRRNPILNFKNIFSVLKENGPYNAVHAHTSFHCGLVSMAAKLAGVQVRISHARTTGSKNHSLKNKIMLCFGRCLIGIFSTHCLAISEAAAAYLYGKNFQRNNKVRILPNSIDDSRYSDIKQESIDALLEEFSLSKDNLIIGHVGRFETMKNHAFLIELAREMVEDRPSAKFVLIGDGRLRPEIEQKVHDYNLVDNVIFCGNRTDVPVWMNIFDVVVMPSIYEGLCGVAIESQAAGTPCVLSTGIPEKETDLGLGLCKYVPLDSPVENWIETISNSCASAVIDKSVILDRLSASGYTLQSGLDEICKIYSLGKE